jgi:hypothetical protein
MGFFAKLIDSFVDETPERASKKKLDAARLLLVEHECQREFYEGSTTVLKVRIARLEAELNIRITTPQRLVAQPPVDSQKRAQI